MEKLINNEVSTSDKVLVLIKTGAKCVAMLNRKNLK